MHPTTWDAYHKIFVIYTVYLTGMGSKYYILTNELFYFCSFCHKCQKPLYYTLYLLRHHSLPYLCTACFALPRLRPFSFVLSACRLYRHAEAGTFLKCTCLFLTLYTIVALKTACISDKPNPTPPNAIETLFSTDGCFLAA